MRRSSCGVLILHGFSAGIEAVGSLRTPLEALGVPTSMPVLRGHGAASPEALRGVRWLDWMADARAALEELLASSERAVVVGHSMGGLLALNLAMERKDAIDSLVLAAAAVELASPVAPHRPLHFVVPLLRLFITRWKLRPRYADPARALGDSGYRWTPAEAIGELFELCARTRPRLGEVHLPALIMQSRRDRTVTPESARIIYDGISTPAETKRLMWFERTGHRMFRDCEREATVRAVVDYVRERVGARAPDRL